MPLAFHTLDVFTDVPFAGNPLAVVMDADRLSGPQMQAIAGEFNLSETIFVSKPADPGNTAAVRIFTPTSELPFAGHPTIGCAILLASLDRKPGCPFETTVRLEEKVGIVPVVVRRLGPEPAYGEFTAPSLPQTGGSVPDAGMVAKAMSLEQADIGFSSHAPSVYKAGNAVLFVPLRSREALARARADLGGWGAVRDAGAVSVYLYCAGGVDADFHARLFAPDLGIPEDPATGSAAATFPGVLADTERLADGVHRWTILQGEDMGRPSRIRLEADIAAGRVTAVRVGGQAVPLSEGTILV